MLSGVINRKRVSGGRQDRTSDNVFGGLGSGSSSLNDAILESTCFFARGVSSWSASVSLSLSLSSLALSLLSLLATSARPPGQSNNFVVLRLVASWSRRGEGEMGFGVLFFSFFFFFFLFFPEEGSPTDGFRERASYSSNFFMGMNS